MRVSTNHLFTSCYMFYLSWETSNPIFGHTVNFLDNARGVGGSSGGEACLIAGGGSIIGLGTDDGGSIRIPCCLCGIYGFKPTSSRLRSASSISIIVEVLVY